MPAVLHILPHPGGGGETYLDLLEGMEGFDQSRAMLSGSRSPLRAAPTMLRRRPRLAGAARRAELVHVHGDMAAMLSLRLLRARPSVVTTHGLHFLRRARGAALAAARQRLTAVARAADRIVCTSAAERDELASGLRGVEDRLVVVPNGISLPAMPSQRARAAARADLGLADDRVAALFLGQLEARKAPVVAVEAAERAAAGGAPVTLLVAGDGPQRDDVEAAAGPAVRVLGFRRDPERLLDAADLLVLPSEREGMSMALLEAMGRGVPVLVSDGAGNAETVGPAGVVTPVGDAAALARALADLARDPERRRRLGEAGRARVADELSAERMIAATRAVYVEVLAGR